MAKILVVEDSEVTRELYKRMLSVHRILECDNGECLTSIVSTEKPDIVLLDMMLADMSGLEALAVLEKDLPNLHLPILVISAVNDAGVATECLRHGAWDYMVKGSATHTANIIRLFVHNALASKDKNEYICLSKQSEQDM